MIFMWSFPTTEDPAFYYLFTFLAHPLTNLNPALNWIFYVLMVQPIHEQYCRIEAAKLLQQRSEEATEELEV